MPPSPQKLVKESAYRVGIIDLFCRLHPQWLRVVNYHGVIERRLRPTDPGYSTTVSAADFEEQLDYLSRRFHPVSLDEVRDWCLEGSKLPPSAVLISFDDGFRNNATVAAPLLRKFRMPAVFFVSTGYIGTRRVFWFNRVRYQLMSWPEPRIRLPGAGGTIPVPAGAGGRRELARRITNLSKKLPNRQRLEYLAYLETVVPWEPLQPDPELEDVMTWDEVRDLADAGFAIGSHTVEHPILARLAGQELTAELVGSRERIERETGRPCYAIAYPNGGPEDYSEQVQRAVQEAGYRLAFTMANRPQPPGGNPYEISRIPAVGHVPLASFSFWVSGLRGKLHG